MIRRKIPSVAVEWPGAHAIGYGPEFKADLLDNIIANTQGLTLILLCLGFLNLYFLTFMNLYFFAFLIFALLSQPACNYVG